MVFETLAYSPFNHLELLAQEYFIEFYTLHLKKVRQVLVQCTRWFKYDQDLCGLFTHKSVPVIFEPPCITANIRFIQTMFTNGVVGLSAEYCS
jgi:hypothetical protein